MGERDHIYHISPCQLNYNRFTRLCIPQECFSSALLWQTQISGTPNVRRMETRITAYCIANYVIQTQKRVQLLIPAVMLTLG